MTASTCSALTRPSPVVVLSRHRMWPEVSPPRMPPRLAQHGRARSGRRPARAGTRCRCSRSASSRPRLLITVPTTGPAQRAAPLAGARDDVQELVAVDDAPEVIDHHEAVAVAVEREPDVRAHARHGQLQQVRRGRAAAVVDVAAVGRAADGHDLGAQVGEHARPDLVGGAVGAVDDDLQARSGRCPLGSVEAQNSWYCVRERSTRVARPEAARGARDGAAARARPRCAPRARRRACAPVASKNLMPLSS